MSSAENYKQLSQREHILHRPDMYIGKKKNEKITEIVYDGNDLIQKQFEYSPGILKMFDEALTNATDNIDRYNHDKSKQTNKIDIEVTSEFISIWNNGSSIPIVKKENLEGKLIYLPQMVFSELNTSSNYDDDKERKRNGCNGVGIKLANIFSKQFEVIIVNNGKKYSQTYKNNMSIIDEPKISKCSEEDSVYVKFYLDFKQFDCQNINEGTKLMIFKRAFDTCLFNIDVSLNNKKIPNLSYKEFCYKHLIAKKIKIDIDELIEEHKNNVQICYGASSKSFVKSYVNHIETIDDGKHVDNFFNQLDKYVETKFKIKDKFTKNNSILFIDQTVDKPTFSGQAKSKLTSIIKTNYSMLCEKIADETDLIELMKNKSLSKLNRKNKVKKPYFERLEDANMAGTKESHKCTLFVCEGLSAASMVSSGFGVLGHDYYGIYSLTGKILNVEKASEEKIDSNIVLSQLMQALGLEYGKKYTSLNGLRYGRIVCMKDADVDGSAIMGLLLNYFYSQFKELLELKSVNFFNEFITPQVQVITKQNKKEEFYNQNEFIKWFNEHSNQSKSIKYLKGLASNSSEDTLRYFKNFNKYLIPIKTDEDSDYWMKMAYGKSKREIELRKQWVQTCTEDTYLPREQGGEIEITPFITEDLLLFSHESCTRSIPNIYDGLKPTQRKILYTLFSLPEKEALRPRKVFELTAKTAEKAHYHHGDLSLNGTIMGMMQTWCGSNNIPLLGHEGFIGSRFGLGQDGGAPRYVYACLNKITRLIFPKIDDELLECVEEDGIIVEPKFYVPIIPMVLINGTNGIGTGYSSYIPLHNYYQIINILQNTLKQCIDDDELEIIDSFNTIIENSKIDLYYPGFKGSFEDHELGYLSTGVFEWVVPESNNGFFKHEIISESNRDKISPLECNPCFLKISEIPISQVGFTHMINTIKNKLMEKTSKPVQKVANKGTSKGTQKGTSKGTSKGTQKGTTQTKKELKYLIDFKNNSVTGNDSQPEKIELYLKFENNGETDVEDFLKEISPMKISETVSTNNMHLFDEHIQIHKYNNIYDIFRKFIEMRYELYIKRKNRIVKKEKREYKIISNKARFIKMIIKEEIVMNKYKISQLDVKLKELKFDEIDNSYNYLTDMSVKWMTEDKYTELLKQKDAKKKYINNLIKTKPEQMWLEDLDKLNAELK